MTRKRPDIRVAILNDDGSSRIDGADELRTQPMFSTTDLLRYLAIHQRNPDLGIPPAVVDALAIAVGGKAEWDKVLSKLAAGTHGNHERRTESDRVGRLLRAEADKLRATHPGIKDDPLAAVLRKTAIARTWIAKGDDGILSNRAIRRYISKK